MRVLFLLNRRDDLRVDQTTTLLIVAAIQEGCEVYVAGVDELLFDAERAEIISCSLPDAKSPHEVISALHNQTSVRTRLTQMSRIVLRINPARSELPSRYFVQLLHLLRPFSERMLNAPSTLLRFYDKTYLLRMPSSLRPKTIWCATVDNVSQAAEAIGSSVVLKPAEGTHGSGVFLFKRRDDTNLRVAAESLLMRGPVLVQEAVFAEGRPGDTRIFVADGEIVSKNGKDALVTRVAAERDHRSNIHAGGQTGYRQLNRVQRDIANRCASWLADEGVRFAGIDLIENKIIEVNSFAPGGLADINHYTQETFEKLIVRILLR